MEINDRLEGFLGRNKHFIFISLILLLLAWMWWEAGIKTTDEIWSNTQEAASISVKTTVYFSRSSYVRCDARQLVREAVYTATSKINIIEVYEDEKKLENTTKDEIKTIIERDGYGLFKNCELLDFKITGIVYPKYFLDRIKEKNNKKN